MKYHWPQRKHNGASEDGKNAVQPCTIELMTAQEFQHAHPAVFRRSFSGYVYQSSRFCKAERLHKATAGTYAMPRQQDLTGEKLTFGYCILEDRLIFLDDRSCVKDLLHQMEGYEMTDISDPRMVFFDFLEFLVKDDIVFLQSYEDSLNELEEDLLARKQDNFERRILQVRKELAVLGAYYEQLSDLGETLQQEAAERGWDHAELLFGLYDNKVGRLFDMVQMLKEYSNQLRELHQTRIDSRQNEIMQFLTIVTTIFMPLTLVAGWYGMNFVNMPELSAPHGYAIICLLCLVCLLLEFWVIRKNKWFR